MLLGRTIYPALETARVVCFSPEQVAALPDWEDDEQLWDFADEFQPPAELMYLDFSSGSAAPEVPAPAGGSIPQRLLGAFVERTKDGLLTAPFTEAPSPSTGESRVGCDAMVATVRDHTVSEERHGTTIRNGAEVSIGLNRVFGDVPDPQGRSIIVAPNFGPQTLARIDARFEAQDWKDFADAQARIAAKALSALTLLEIDAAELTPIELANRDRKRAEKRRWRIADTVTFRRSAPSSTQTTTTASDESRYSHRFFVIGHTRHFPAETRIGGADGGRWLRPCRRARCGGQCRKIRVRTYIKGPEDKPLKPKTLLVR